MCLNCGPTYGCEPTCSHMLAAEKAGTKFVSWGEHGLKVAIPDIKVPKSGAINHPQHYGGDTVYETINVIEAWGLGFHLGNAVKYISRAGKKNPGTAGEDIDKAVWYLQRWQANEHARLVKENSEAPDAEKRPAGGIWMDGNWVDDYKKELD